MAAFCSQETKQIYKYYKYSTVSPNVPNLAWMSIHFHVMWQNVKLFNYAAYVTLWFLSLEIELAH